MSVVIISTSQIMCLKMICQIIVKGYFRFQLRTNSVTNYAMLPIDCGSNVNTNSLNLSLNKRIKRRVRRRIQKPANLCTLENVFIKINIMCHAYILGNMFSLSVQGTHYQGIIACHNVTKILN